MKWLLVVIALSGSGEVSVEGVGPFATETML